MSKPFTDLEKQKLSEFRLKVYPFLKTDEQRDDYFLIRWLRARNLDIPKAEEMLKKSLKWREDNKVDGILDREHIPMKYKKIYPTATFGQDKDGSPVIMLPLGRFNHKIFIEDEGLSQCLRFNIIWAEGIMQIVKDAEKSSGKKGLQIVEIIDMEYYSYKELMYKPARDFLYETQKTFDDNYPEMLKTMFIINAPKVFAILFKMMKPLFAKETLDKMDIYGPDENTWKQVLAEKFDKVKIPTRWGGALKGLDPFCSQDVSVWPDGPIPLAYFTNEVVDEEGFTMVKIGARDKLKVEYEVEDKNAILKWSFRTDYHDIGFQLDGPDGTNFVTWGRYNTFEESIECQNVGKYIILFDNSFSYTKSKTVYYRIDLIPMEDGIDISLDDGDINENSK